MSDTLKLKYKVGEIEFEAEGPADAVEQQFYERRFTCCRERYGANPICF